MRSLLVLLTMFASAAQAAGPATFTPTELRADLAQLVRALHEMPPDLARTADVAQLERAVRDIDAQLTAPLDRDAAWRLFATLNPLLADGHLFVGFVDWRGDTRAHLAAGGLLFPFEMHVTPDCGLHVSSALGGNASEFDGARIQDVNGLPAATLCEQLLARVHGDTRRFRADLLSRRFFFYYWKTFGAPSGFEIILEGRGEHPVAGSTQLPRFLADETRFERQFELRFIDGKPAAVLKLGTFFWPEKQQVLDFTRDAFTRLRAAGTRSLVIDLRDNGGGNDDEWIDGLMPYIAGRPFRIASGIRRRVVVADAARHEVAGSVVDGRIDDWFPPDLKNPLRFRGKVLVLAGPGTFSSAVTLATVMQDFRFGRVAGPRDCVRASVSGGARRTTLTHSGLIVVAPRFILTRPSGAHEPGMFTPDIDFDEARSPEELPGL